MRKQVRQNFRKSLCGMLSAAMIATSLIVPNMTVYAAPQDDEASMASVMTENEEDKLVDESTVVMEDGEDKEKDSASENPSGSVDGDNENADGKDSEDGNGSGEESGDIADEDDKGNSDGEDEKNPDGDLTDDGEADIDKDLKSEEEEVEAYAISPATEVEDEAEDEGPLKNGKFERVTTNGSDEWTGSAEWTLEGGLWPTKNENNKKNTSIYLYYSYWLENADENTPDKETFAKQEIKNLEPGVYRMSVEAGGTYEDGKFTLTVTDDSGEKLTSKSLGAGQEWGTWETYTTDTFEVTESNNSAITVTISGTLALNKDIHLDNVKLELAESAGTYGTLQNGGFEEKDSDSDWTLKSWTQEGEGKSYTQGNAASNTTRHVSWWSNEAGDLTLSQTIENIEPAVYVLSFETYGNYTTADKILVSIANTSLVADEALGDGPGWTWKEFKTKAFGISSPDNGEPVNITITISGYRGADETVKFDNFELTKLSYTLEQLKKLFEEAGAYVEANYTAESWKIFAEKKNDAERLLTSDNTDTVEITLAYAELKAAMDDLVLAGMTFYYYVGELTKDKKPIKEVGLCYWGTNNTNVSTTAEQITEWHGWNGNDATYKMTATAYAGWYSIPLRFENSGEEAGFSIHVYDGETSTLAGKYQTNESADIYNQLAKSTESVCAVKGDVCYEGNDKATAIMRQVTLHVYDPVDIPYLQLGKADAETLSVVNEETGTSALLAGGKTMDGAMAYPLKPDEEYKNWYYITFSAPGTLEFDSKKICNLYIKKSEEADYGWSKDFMNGSEDQWGLDFTPVFAGETYYKDGEFFATLEAADPDAKLSLLDKLQELVDKAKELKEEDYKEKGWAVFTKALTAAEKVLQAAEDAEKDESKTAPTDDEIQKAYDDLEAAMKALVPASAQEVEINVNKIELADDFITGADISSYLALRQSGTVFKDENGKELSDAEFFQYLHDGGTNWIRIRVWNDPYDGDGNGYGGGNNDLDKAKIMGKLATDAGMKVLIDFHYSDFWADPGKQKAPKAWASMSFDDRVEAVKQFTKDSLNALKDAGVDVGMVQVGNETTKGICGVNYENDGWDAAAEIYKAGSKAVKEFDKNCLVAIHFTNPEKTSTFLGLAGSLDEKEVEYDVLATSYYPYWHGTTENLTYVLAQVAETYGKKVMVAETSWATTLDDQDGHANTVRKGENDKDQPYSFSVQGQADEIRAVVEAVNNVNKVEGVKEGKGSAIGVFYWESAWLSPYYAYNDDGTQNKELHNKNKAAWEQYGSGWASSYAKEYDPDDAGKWYGGSAVDNQAWFGFDGKALPTAKVYSYIRTGATTEKAVMDVVNPSITINAGETVEYPEKVTVKFNDGSSAEYAVIWNAGDQAEVDTEIPGDYEISGTVTCEYTLKDGSTKTETKNVTLTITVKPVIVPELINPGFENTNIDPWKITGNEGNEIGRKNEDPRSGSYGLHFWAETAGTFTVTQKIENLAAGTYVFGGYIQADTAGTKAEAVVNVYDSEGKLKETKTAPCTPEGWKVWQNPEITGINVSEGDSLEVGMEVSAAAGGWGTIDDFYLYRAYEYDILIDDQIKHGTVSSNVAKSISGETITVTATPETGYILSKLMVSGRSVTGATLTDKHGTVTYDTATKTVVLTYNAKVTEKTEESFTMPNSKVTVSAVFRTNVDVAALDKLIAEYEQLNADGYTEESWKAFTDALTAAKAASENVDATQAEIDSAKAALETAYAGLTKATTGVADLTALNALIAKYDSVTNDGYTEASWKTFTAALAAAKEAVKKENVTQAEVDSAKAALEAAYKGLTKASTGVVDLTALNALIAKYETVTNDGYTKASWNTFTDALAAAKEAAKKENVTQAEVDSAKAALEKAYAGLVKAPVRTGLWAEWTDEWAELLSNDNTITYTGKAIKPTVKVYDGETLLTSSSYSVSYQNNTKVGEAGVIIKGKGNYTGSCTMKFKIDYVDLENDSDVSITNLYVAASKNGNPVSVKPVVTWKGKKVNAKLYDVVLPDKSEGAYVAPGTYNVEVKAKENNGIYKGSREIKITLVDISNDAQVLMSSVKVKFNFKSMPWKEGGVTLDSSKDIMVTYKNEPLEENTNYTLDYENNDRIGTATVIITGTGTPENKGRFVGELRKTFKITGTAIKAADVKLNIAEPIVYNGTDHEPAVQIEGLKENTDFEVTYQNNRNAGKKATAIITGINGYSGTVKKTFTIAAHDVNQADVNIVVNENAPVAYEKGGSKPPVEVIFDGGILVPGTDYTVSYAKNAKVTEGATAEVRITGKGNFTQKKTLTFAIGKQSLEELKATAADQTNPKKWNKVSPVITDVNGKALKKGTDYEKTFTYKLYDANNAEVTATAEPAVGMRVEVTATGKGSYEGMITAEYRIIDSKQSIAKARITVTPQTYTGEAIELSKDAIKLELKDGSDWKPLSADQYEIVGYSNNINKGKAAKVTIHGLTPYGGTKTVKFEIKAQSMEGISWAERIASMFERMFN